MSSQMQLLGARRFMPLFTAQTLGAFNDNLLKTALVMLVPLGAMKSAVDRGALAAMAGGALMLPYFLFSATAGELADRFERARLLQVLKAAELIAVVAAVGALLTGSVSLSFLSLFVLGAQAAFSSPVRYSLMPPLVRPEGLVDGHALLEAAPSRLDWSR